MHGCPSYDKWCYFCFAHVHHVFCFAQSLDLKGKEKFHDQVSVQSFAGCSHCCVTFPKGCQGPVFGVARRYLPDGHPLRRKVSAPYEYPEQETNGIYITHINYAATSTYKHTHAHMYRSRPAENDGVCMSCGDQGKRRSLHALPWAKRASYVCVTG